MATLARTLVVQYSRTGTTRRAAAEIARVLGADLEDIVDRTPRQGVLGYLRSSVEAGLRLRARIAVAARDPGQYDLVVVGTPIWNASVSSPVRAYLAQHAPRIKNVAFFCTCGGRWGERAFRQMTRLSGLDPTAVLVLRQRDVVHGDVEAPIARFAKEIEDALASRSPARAAPVPAAPVPAHARA